MPSSTSLFGNLSKTIVLPLKRESFITASFSDKWTRAHLCEVQEKLKKDGLALENSVPSGACLPSLMRPETAEYLIKATRELAEILGIDLHEIKMQY